jgi:hypothetical protein
MIVKRRWLEPFTWEFVTAQNRLLCQNKSSHHGPTSDGYDVCKVMWEEHTTREMSLLDAIEVCRKSHRMAPFTNFNGNTFSAIARTMVKQLELEPELDYHARSLAGHIVAGVAGEEETEAFRRLCEAIGV